MLEPSGENAQDLALADIDLRFIIWVPIMFHNLSKEIKKGHTFTKVN